MLKERYNNSPNLSLAFLGGILGEALYFIGNFNNVLSALILLRIPVITIGLVLGLYELKFLKKLNKNKLIVSLGLFMCVFSVLEVTIKIMNKQPL